MAKRILLLGVALIMCLGLFAGCGDDISTDRVSVMIKAEFREKFETEGFSIEDFEWDNVERIEYGTWYEKTSRGWMTVYLKKHSKKRVYAAIEHFNKLDFVDSADAMGEMNLIQPIK